MKKDQTITVDGSRTKVVKTNETHTVKADRTRFVVGNENVTVNAHQNTLIKKGNRSVTTEMGMQTFASKDVFTITQNDGESKITLNGGIGMLSDQVIDMHGSNFLGMGSDGEVRIEVGASTISVTPTSIVLRSPNISLISAMPALIMPSTRTPSVLYSGGGAGDGAGQDADGEGDGTSDAAEGEGQSGEDQRAAEHAALLQHARHDGSPLPEGWEQVEGGRWTEGEDGVDATLYREIGSDPPRYVLAYPGTASVQDEVTDGVQGLGLEDSQYAASTRVADEAVDIAGRDGGTLELTGHSMGGGMAALNGARTGLPTNTFNAAGVHEDTLDRYGAGNSSQDNITNYSAQDDPLTWAQEGSDPFAVAAPDALGRQRQVIARDENGNVQSGPSTHSIDPVARGMQQGDTTARTRRSSPNWLNGVIH